MENLSDNEDINRASSKIKNIMDLYRGMNDFKKVYQPRNNVVTDEKGDLVADCYSIVSRWKKYFSQLLKVHAVNDTKHTFIYTSEPLVPEPSAFEVHKSPGIDQIPAELIKAGGRKIRHEIHNLIFSIWNKEGLPEE